ncbi:hypothetical protein F5Y13DRAFT_78136 [Hypoxylon sp. FL1857]|nr:hypothetical protein F5Y13DRAFT_78136 [Hypoxylon sp. FL1857]
MGLGDMSGLKADKAAQPIAKKHEVKLFRLEGLAASFATDGPRMGLGKTIRAVLSYFPAKTSTPWIIQGYTLCF